MPIILASQSPRRKELLTLAAIEFEVVVANTDESYPTSLTFAETAIHIAKNKALAVQQKVDENATIIAADTIVICDNKIIGKPTDNQNAIDILTQLSGNMHQVITGVYIIKNEKNIFFADATTVYFHQLSIEQITFYVEKYKPFDKAGAYAIQEWIGAIGIKKVEGDFYNVMGLPISRVVKALEELG